MASIGILDGLLKAFGEELTTLHGELSTRLTATLAAADVVATVESTLDFPDAGVLYLEGERVPYTSRAETSFGGLVRDPLTASDHLAGTEVADGSRSFSQLHRLRGDGLVTRAAGSALDRFGWRHGERRPLAIPDTAYRALRRGRLDLERGLLSALVRVLDAALLTQSRSGVAGTLLPQPNRLLAALGTFSSQDVGRPLYVGERVYRVREVAADGSSLDLQPGAGVWWCAGNFGDGNDVSYRIPPFRVLELPDTDPGIVLVDLVFSGSSLGPPSYLLGDILPGVPELTPGGWPLGHEILEDELEDGATFLCWYLPGLPDEDLFRTMLEEVVAAGVDVRLNSLLAV